MTLTTVLPRRPLLGVCRDIDLLGQLYQHISAAISARDREHCIQAIDWLCLSLTEDVDRLLGAAGHGEMEAAVLEVRARLDALNVASSLADFTSGFQALEAAGRHLQAVLDATPGNQLLEALLYPAALPIGGACQPAPSPGPPNHAPEQTGSPKEKLPPLPQPLAIRAYQLRQKPDKPTETSVADQLSRELGRRIHQGTISKWLTKVQAYIDAGGSTPPDL